MIAIFIGHHTKSNVLLDELILESQFIFENNEVSKLTKEELSFFDRNESLIIKSVLPTVHENIDKNRMKLLEQKSEIEEAKTHRDFRENIDKQDNEDGVGLINEIRLAFRTAEVMSMIIKNRSGSLEKDILNDIYEKIFWLLMRVQGSFISIIRDEEVEKSFIDFVAHETIEVINEKKIKSGEVLDREISSIAKKIYWNLNFTVIYSLISRCINNLGSSYLIDISEEFKNKENSPSYLLVYYGIKMQYAKTIPINEMSEFSTSKEQSYTAQNILKRLVVNHCKYHRIEEKKLQQIESKLGIPKQKMLIEYNNKHNK